MKKLSQIFLLSFFLNLIWENFHSLLYAQYQGGPITEFILLHATLGDAMMLTILALPFFYFDFFKKNIWLIIPIGIVIAVSIEWYALGAGRWAYNDLMPIIPFLNVGLTPTLQLGLIGYLVFSLVI